MIIQKFKNIWYIKIKSIELPQNEKLNTLSFPTSNSA